ncbi:inactive protein RESTRICTED TEV MOVEMENT 2-like [Quercus lobata]|uniref:SHSP domain-containing protein n=1 Tax=Quercus lobata TaxID=97700 RepID=A0A7N2MY69_QUELO|nr:inactive protein RESTRICTED TEV MOVEMENT 2-like [Quercus lobata]
METKYCACSHTNYCACARVYEDFEPYCKWHKGEERDTLEVHLRDFNKEQLKAQINNHGVLKIFGERPLKETRWSRFNKEINVDKKCKTCAIQAKFGNGVLSVIMPKTGLRPTEKAIILDGICCNELVIERSILKQNLGMAVKVLAVAVVVAFGAYATYKCTQPCLVEN